MSVMGRSLGFMQPVGDPYFSSVVLLMHMNGSDGSTTFTDVKGHTFTRTGTSTISTTQSKFGGASYLSAASSYLTASPSADWNLNGVDFTVEFWARPSSSQNLSNLIGTANPWFGTGDIGSPAGWGLNVGTSSLKFNGSGNNQFTQSITWANATWQHIAWTRSGSTYYYFQDGVLLGSTSTGTLASDSVNSLFVGGNVDHASNSAYIGNIDEIRVTKGVCRYTGTFTPPSEPFPDF